MKNLMTSFFLISLLIFSSSYQIYAEDAQGTTIVDRVTKKQLAACMLITLTLGAIGFGMIAYEQHEIKQEIVARKKSTKALKDGLKQVRKDITKARDTHKKNTGDGQQHGDNLLKVIEGVGSFIGDLLSSTGGTTHMSMFPGHH